MRLPLTYVQNSTHRVSIAKAAQSAVALMTKRLGLASGGAPGEGRSSLGMNIKKLVGGLVFSLG